MAKNCYGRRLSELLQEHQEPFLLHGGAGATEAVPCCSVAEACRRRLLGLCDHGSVRKRRGISSSNAGRSKLGRVFCGMAVRMALRWDLAGCFSCGGAREIFRRLPRAGDIGDCDVVMEFDDDSARHGRQLSPVSVLELHSDEEYPMLSNWEDDDEPSTSGSSPPSDQDFIGATSPCFTFYNDEKIGAMQVEDKEKVMRSGKSMKEQVIISSWERIAGDISKIPLLVELDFPGSLQEWRRLREEEVSLVGTSIEAMIFEEIRGEAVRDMIS